MISPEGNHDSMNFKSFGLNLHQKLEKKTNIMQMQKKIILTTKVLKFAKFNNKIRNMN